MISSNFIYRINDLMYQNYYNYMATMLPGSSFIRFWMVPFDSTEYLFNDPTIKDKFDRTDLNNFSNPANLLTSKAGVRMAVKAQADYLSAMERAFRLRHTGYIRAVAHSTARNLGHSNSVGPFGRVINYMSDLMSSGG